MNEQRQEHTVEVADLLGLFARSLRRLWWLCLMLIVLCAAAFGGYARLSYRPQYTASMTFLVNVGGAAQSGSAASTATASPPALSRAFGKAFLTGPFAANSRSRPIKNAAIRP